MIECEYCLNPAKFGLLPAVKTLVHPGDRNDHMYKKKPGESVTILLHPNAYQITSQNGIVCRHEPLLLP